MVKVLVAYMSKTGNTRKVAEAMFEVIDGEKEIKPIDEVDTIEGYGVAFLGFPIHQEGPDKKAARLLEQHCTEGRKVVLFITHAAPEDNPELPPMLDKFRQAARGAEIVGFFDCQGQLDKSTKRIMSMLPSAKLRRWAREDNSAGQPDQARLDRARAFSRSVMERLHEVGAEPDRVSRAGRNLKIEYFHASKYGNGARVAEEFKKQMAGRGIAVNVRHVREAKPREIPPADLYLFSSPGRMGKPIGDMSRFLKEARLPAGARCAILTTELAPQPDKNGRLPSEEELGKCQRMIPIMDQMVREKGLVNVAQTRVFVTRLKGPLEEGWQEKVEVFASGIVPAPDAAAEESPARPLVLSAA